MTIPAIIATNDNGAVLAPSSYEVPRNGWDVFSEVLLVFSWIGALAYIVQVSTELGFEIPPQWFELTLLVMLAVLNLIVGSRLLWWMCQRQRACKEEAQRCRSNNTLSSDGVAVDQRPGSCDARSFFTLVLSLGWWFFKIRRYDIVKWGLWRGLWMGLNWRGGPTSLAIGLLVGAVMIQFVAWALNSINRKYSAWTFNGGLKCVNRKHSCLDPKLAPTMPFAAAAGTLLLLSISGFIVSYLQRVDAIEPMQSLFSLPTINDNQILYDKWGSTPYYYNGAAYVRNVTVEDLEDQMEVCKEYRYKDIIHVDVDVYFGGSWACPVSPDAQCETTVQSEVDCGMLNFDLRNWDTEWKDITKESSKIEDATAQDYYDAIQRHYHNYDNKNIGNDDYDPYGFDDDDAFDPDSTPPSRNTNWYVFTESIFGNCGTCEAMSLPAFRRAVDKGCRATTDAHVFLGAMIAAVCCLAAVFVPKKKSSVVEESPTPFAPIGSGNE